MSGINERVNQQKIFMKKTLYLILIASLCGCSGETTPEEQEERVEQIRKQATKLQERVEEMRPTIDAQAQKRINRVERRIESEESP